MKHQPLLKNCSAGFRTFRLEQKQMWGVNDEQVYNLYYSYIALEL